MRRTQAGAQHMPITCTNFGCKFDGPILRHLRDAALQAHSTAAAE